MGTGVGAGVLTRVESEYSRTETRPNETHTKKTVIKEEDNETPQQPIKTTIYISTNLELKLGVLDRKDTRVAHSVQEVDLIALNARQVDRLVQSPDDARVTLGEGVPSSSQVKSSRGKSSQVK